MRLALYPGRKKRSTPQNRQLQYSPQPTPRPVRKAVVSFASSAKTAASDRNPPLMNTVLSSSASTAACSGDRENLPVLPS
jgi:hypothetical protein